MRVFSFVFVIETNLLNSLGTTPVILWKLSRLFLIIFYSYSYPRASQSHPESGSTSDRASRRMAGAWLAATHLRNGKGSLFVYCAIIRNVIIIGPRERILNQATAIVQIVASDLQSIRQRNRHTQARQPPQELAGKFSRWTVVQHEWKARTLRHTAE